MYHSEQLPFRHIEQVSPIRDRPVIIQSQCAFCSFSAASTDERLIAFAEVAHHCPGILDYRLEQSHHDTPH